VEYRQRIGGSFGTAVFVDAGQVDASSAPFQGSVKIGAGLGLRYYTPIGPIRVDVAVPLVHQPNSGTFQVYIGIGQAF
jgi:translocation and assembly module TamA